MGLRSMALAAGAARHPGAGTYVFLLCALCALPGGFGESDNKISGGSDTKATADKVTTRKRSLSGADLGFQPAVEGSSLLGKTSSSHKTNLFKQVRPHRATAQAAASGNEALTVRPDGHFERRKRSNRSQQSFLQLETGSDDPDPVTAFHWHNLASGLVQVNKDVQEVQGKVQETSAAAEKMHEENTKYVNSIKRMSHAMDAGKNALKQYGSHEAIRHGVITAKMTEIVGDGTDAKKGTMVEKATAISEAAKGDLQKHYDEELASNEEHKQKWDDAKEKIEKEHESFAGEAETKAVQEAEEKIRAANAPAAANLQTGSKAGGKYDKYVVSQVQTSSEAGKNDHAKGSLAQGAATTQSSEHKAQSSEHKEVQAERVFDLGKDSLGNHRVFFSLGTVEADSDAGSSMLETERNEVRAEFSESVLRIMDQKNLAADFLTACVQAQTQARADVLAKWLDMTIGKADLKVAGVNAWPDSDKGGSVIIISHQNEAAQKAQKCDPSMQEEVQKRTAKATAKAKLRSAGQKTA